MIPPASPLLDMISALLFGSENLILLGSFVDSQIMESSKQNRLVNLGFFNALRELFILRSFSGFRLEQPHLKSNGRQHRLQIGDTALANHRYDFSALLDVCQVNNQPWMTDHMDFLVSPRGRDLASKAIF